MIGMFAFSKAGHDKGTLYIIIKEEREYVYVADGAVRTLSHPKKKNCRHIQVVKKYRDAGLCENLRMGIAITDEQIKRAIKLYENDRMGEKNVKSGCY